MSFRICLTLLRIEIMRHLRVGTALHMSLMTWSNVIRRLFGNTEGNSKSIVETYVIINVLSLLVNNLEADVLF